MSAPQFSSPHVVKRCRLARERAGLSVGQAAKLLGIARDDLLRIEEIDSCYADADQVKLVDVYGVNAEWLSGCVELRDYAALRRIAGADELLFHDRDILAEFVASMPRGQR